MILLSASLSVLLFVVIFISLGVIGSARLALSKVSVATQVLRSATLSDDEKEAAVQSAAVELLGCVVSILWRSAACVLAALAPIYSFSAFGLVEPEAVFRFLLRWDVLVISTLIIVALMFAISRAKKST